LIGPVGGQYSYSTHAYTLVGAALEEATGKNIGQLFRDEITTPYGLSSLRPEDLSWNNPERARIYSWDGSENDELAFDNVSWKVLGGGLESSVYDLTRFGMRLVDEGIVSAAGMDTLFTRPDALRNYGLGWATGTESGELRVNHNGSWTGASSFIQLYPDQDIVIVVLGNARGLDVTTLGRSIGTLVLDETLAVAAAGAADAMAGEFQPSEDFAVDATTGVIIGPVTPIVPVLPLLGAAARLSLEPDFDAPASDDPLLPPNLALPLLVPTLVQLNLETISTSLAPLPDQVIVPATPVFKIFMPTVVK
jgi:CubicO group peptidase (beta-lactamase class C family)